MSRCRLLPIFDKDERMASFRHCFIDDIVFACVSTLNQFTSFYVKYVWSSDFIEFNAVNRTRCV